MSFQQGNFSISFILEMLSLLLQQNKTRKPPFRKHPEGAIIETCDIWDIDYNTDSWEPEFMTIFVTWQLVWIGYGIEICVRTDFMSTF